MSIKSDSTLPLPIERSPFGDDISTAAIFPEDILHSPLLKSSECKKIKSSERSLAERKKGLWPRTAKETGGKAHQCMDDWTSNLPELQRILAVGFDPKISPPKKMTYDSLETSVSLVTPVNIDNLHVVEDQCRLWRGLPLVAIVYVPLHVGSAKDSEKQKNTRAAVLDSAVLDVLRMVKKIHAGKYCQLTLEVVAERLCSSNHDRPSAMPLNALRNRGLRLVMSQGVLLGDGRHLISHRVSKTIRNKKALSSLLRAANQSVGLVIPSFYPSNPWYGRLGRQLALEVATMPGKFLIEKAVKQKQLEGPFGWMTNDPGLTPFQMWFSLKGNNNKISLESDASAQVLVLKEKAPYFDERLRGYHMSQSLHMRHSEMLSQQRDWSIMGVGWAIRVHHGQEIEEESTSLQQANRKLYQQSLKLIKNGSYTPIVGFSELCYMHRKDTSY